MQKPNAPTFEWDSRWVWVRAHGARIRQIGERLEFCQPALDDFALELAELEKATKAVRLQIEVIAGRVDSLAELL